MALVRVSVARLLASALPSAGKGYQGSAVFFTQTARISSIHVEGRKTRPPPFPYKEKDYTLFSSIFDSTTHRFDENTKVIVVDGPIAAGKTALAKKLAEEFDMHYVPEANMDMLYINEYGFDLRQLDPQLPPNCKSYDIKDLNLRPDLQFAASLQIFMYQIRYEQYIDALAHLLNTGQGIVMDRSVYSDFVFLEAVQRQGYISPGGSSVYYDMRSNSITDLMTPHLVVYLDVPAKLVAQRIKQRNIPYEVHSKLMNDKYLADIEELYKQSFLKDINIHSELLIYDWSEYGEVDVVVEDIERIDLDNLDKYDIEDKKFKDWRSLRSWDWNDARIVYTTEKSDLLANFNIARYDVPEVLVSGEEEWIRRKVLDSAPGMKYDKGYNAVMGDTGLWNKTTDYKKKLV